MLALSRTRTPLYLIGDDEEPTQPIPVQSMLDLVQHGPASDGVPAAIESDARTEPVILWR